MHSSYLNAVRNFEGFAARAEWDYAQHSNGFGTKALYPGEVIDHAEADRRFRAEITQAERLVDQFAPGLDTGTRAALTSLTYNAGTKWMQSGLGDAIQRGDLATARQQFIQYTKAGGEVLPGLVSRRLAEASWIANPEAARLAAQPVGRDLAAAGLLGKEGDILHAATGSRLVAPGEASLRGTASPALGTPRRLDAAANAAGVADSGLVRGDATSAALGDVAEWAQAACLAATRALGPAPAFGAEATALLRTRLTLDRHEDEAPGRITQRT